jgi:AraC-like DNA-binding protein
MRRQDHATVAPSDQAFRFLTDEWPERDRIKAARNLYGRTIMRRTFLPHEFEPLGNGPLQLDVACHTLPDLGLAYVTCSNLRVHRTRALVVDDHLALNVNLSGGRTVSHCGREITTHEGEALLTTGAETCDATLRESQFISFRVPAKAIAASVRDLDDHIARPIGRDNEALKLLTGYAALLQNPHATATLELRRVAAMHMHDLVALTLGATRDAAEVAEERGARAARLSAIKADIAQNIACEDLSVAAIAARHRLPVRYVQRLFETEGVTFTQFVLGQRLARARQILINPRFAHVKISAIAMDAGFGNLSYFNQSFRRRYGASPSDVRAQAQRGH